MTSIGQSIVIQGDVSSEEDLRIEGRVHGQIAARTGTLTIGPSARIEADVRGARVRIEGAVQGNISATERIELGTSAQVTGSLSANVVVLADGARFNGHIDMGQRTIAAAVARSRGAILASAQAARSR
jgi:cytoskeletal protein CcmA (bactofilin family)